MKFCPTCKREVEDEADFCERDGSLLLTSVADRVKPKDPLVGDVIDGRYRVEEPLGEGTLGTVYKATHMLIEKPVALKVLRRDHLTDVELVERFLREARAASRLSHPNIASVTDFGRTVDGVPFLVMDLYDGETLETRLQGGQHLPVRDAVRLAVDIGDALGAAHRRDIIHREVKPATIALVARKSGGQRAKLLDFGMAKIDEAGQRLTRAGQVVGSPKHMAPEQAAGQTVDQRADIFALGILLYRMVTGRLPFEGDTPVAQLRALLGGRYPSPRALAPDRVSPALEAVIEKALAIEPEGRYPTAEAMLAALHAPAVSESPGADAPAPRETLGSAPMPAPRAPQPTRQGHGSAPADQQKGGEVVAAGRQVVDAEALEERQRPDQRDGGASLEVETEPAVRTVSVSTSRSWHGAPPLVQPVNRERRQLLIVGAVAALAALVGVLAARYVGREGEPKTAESRTGEAGASPPVPAPIPTAPAAVKPSPAPLGIRPLPRRVRLSLVSVPPGAVVRLDGRLVGKTPLDVELPARDRPVTAAITKPGYRPAWRTLRLSRDVKLRLVLRLRGGYGRPRWVPPPRGDLRPRPLVKAPRPVIRPRPIMRPYRPPRRPSLGELKDPFAPMLR